MRITGLREGVACLKGFPGGSAVKNPPANAGDARDAVLTLGREDSLEVGMATIPVFLLGESHG